MRLLERVLNVLYPKTCCFCGKVCRTDICKKCEENITYIEEPLCKKCGKPIRYEEKEYCTDCTENRFSYEQGRSVWLHTGKVRWSVYQFKYHNRRIYGEFYAKEMFRLYEKLIKSWNIDVIIPIPLHWRRRQKRGYNQAEIVARNLGKMIGLPVCSKAVVRVRNTRPQKELNHKERKKNMKDAFRLTKHCETWKNVLLIDDIYTTGNTVDSLAVLLKQHGVHKVCFLTISIGQGF